jgi:hypothetical protein
MLEQHPCSGRWARTRFWPMGLVPDYFFDPNVAFSTRPLRFRPVRCVFDPTRLRHIIREGDKLFTTLFVNKKFIGSIGSHPKKGTFLNADQTLVSYDGTFEVEIERVTTAGTSTSG